MKPSCFVRASSSALSAAWIVSASSSSSFSSSSSSSSSSSFSPSSSPSSSSNSSSSSVARLCSAELGEAGPLWSLSPLSPFSLLWLNCKEYAIICALGLLLLLASRALYHMCGQVTLSPKLLLAVVAWTRVQDCPLLPRRRLLRMRRRRSCSEEIQQEARKKGTHRRGSTTRHLNDGHSAHRQQRKKQAHKQGGALFFFLGHRREHAACSLFSCMSSPSSSSSLTSPTRACLVCGHQTRPKYISLKALLSRVTNRPAKFEAKPNTWVCLTCADPIYKTGVWVRLTQDIELLYLCFSSNF